MLAVSSSRTNLLTQDELETLRLDWGRGTAAAAALAAASPSALPLAAAAKKTPSTAAQVQAQAPPKPEPPHSRFDSGAMAPENRSVPQGPRQAISPPSQQTPPPMGRKLLRQAFPPLPGPTPVVPTARPSAGGQPVGAHPPLYAPAKFGFTKWNGAGGLPRFSPSKTPVPQPDNYAGYRLGGFRPGGKKMVPAPTRFFQAPPAVAAQGPPPRKRERMPEEGDRTYPEGLAFVFDTSTLMELEQRDLDALLQENRIILPNVVVHELDEHNKRRRLGQGTERRAQKAVELRDWIASVLERPEDSHERRHLRLQRVEEVDEKHYAQKRVQDDEIVACGVFFRDRYAGKNLEVYVATDDKILMIKCASAKIKTANSADLIHWSTRKVA